MVHQGGVRQVAFTADGRTLVSVGDDRTVRHWDVASGRELRQMPGRLGAYRLQLFVSPDGRLAAALDEESPGNVEKSLWRVWDLVTGQLLHSLRDDFACFSPDGQLLATAPRDNQPEKLRVLDARTGVVRAEVPCRPSSFFQFLPGGGLLMVTMTGEDDKDTELFVWDLEPVKCRLRKRLKGKELGWFTLSADASTLWGLAGTREPRVKRWDAVTGEPIGPTGRKIENPLQMMPQACANRTTYRTARGDDGWAIICDVRTQRVRSFRVCDSGCFLVELSPDARLMAQFDDPSGIRLWDVDTGTEITSPPAR
jgi:WD40 repeat protein